MYQAIAAVIQNQFCSTQCDKSTKPSSQAVAVWRAAHQCLEQPLIFNDPLALPILGEAKSDVLDKLELHKDPLSSAMRVSIAVRSRFAEDERESSLKQGVNQYVILGAGLDTYAYRSQSHQEKVFEVDLPSTQAMKLARLNQQNIVPRCSVNYVACDFEENELENKLLAAGFDKSQKAFFSCLGVVAYLEKNALVQTLEFIASCAPGSILTFDYIVDPSLLSKIEQLVLHILSQQLTAGGEPLKSFFVPQVLANELTRCGYSQVEDISPDYLNHRYLAQREDGLRVGNVTRMFMATV